MPEMIHPLRELQLARIEPGDRLVVLARTLQARDPAAEATLKSSAAEWARFGETCLGQALYWHRTVFRDAADPPTWSHLELSYFRDMIPADAILALVAERQPMKADLLRAEILVTTPSSFVLPRDWQGSAARPERQASLEYIDVQPACLGAYRDVMREYCGPAAARLVRAGRIGTFRAMETAAVLYHDPGLKCDWNQIHLCELDPSGFDGFDREFEAALPEVSPNGAASTSVFSDIDRMRTVRRWTFNDPVVEADAAVAQ